jgi:NADP-dependent 3-hydroxy acid dehydrogenase YdfG
MSTLKGKVAWITGAGTGIGHSAASELAAAGATVILSGRRKDVLDAAVKEIATAGGRAEAQALDVSDKAAVAKGAAEIFKRHAGVDILVNCAGTNVAKRFYKDLVPEDWDKVISINLNGALYCTVAVLPAMRAKKDGLVINISSWLGRWPGYLGGPAYNASKHAMAAMTHQINIEEGVNGIRGCVIYPGEVATPILKARPIPPSQQAIDAMLKAEDLGRAVRFVAETSPRVCFNEIVITPTWNRIIIGDKDVKLAPDRPGA